MRAREFVAEAKTVEYNGLSLRIKKPTSYELRVEALDDWGNNVLGYVEFDIGDDRELDPQDLRVDDRYQGQGIAKTMYDYVKSLGYKIVRSWDQTDAGAGFWDKHRGEDVRVWEAFDNPYKTKTEKSDYGDVDMLAKLPDGTNLSIMFNNQGDNEWQVEFYRDNSQEITGQGDAQRIFATVLAAIQKFVKKYQPDVIKFSAEKSNNSDSRSSLYDRLVARFAQQLGYNDYSEEYMSSTMYELSKQSQGVAEEQLDELSFLGSECTKDCSGHRAGYDWSKRKGLRQANSWSPSFNKGAGLAVAGK
jgi:GNAT superfamily N-acetyltransferase